MNHEETAARQAIVQQAMDAITSSELDNAWEALENWRRCHPEDEGIEDAFEMLAPLRLANSKQTPAASVKSQRRKDAKREERVSR